MRLGGLASMVILMAGLVAGMAGRVWHMPLLSFGLGLLLFLPILGLIWLIIQYLVRRQVGLASLAGLLIVLVIGVTWLLHITK